MLGWGCRVLLAAAMCCWLSGLLADRQCADWKFGHGCISQCHCANNTQCDDVTGSCTSGCASEWSGSACQRKNVAYNMAATIRVRGDKTVGRVATDGDPSTCVTSTQDRTGWWKVDLLSSQSVFSMRIYTGNGSSYRGWHVYVTSDDYDLFWLPDQLCTTLRYHGNDTYFTCDKPALGRYVILMSSEGPITLCELEVYACADYSYGVEDCNSSCKCADSVEVCDHVFGRCISGCREGWSGTNCQNACVGSYGRNCVNGCGRCHDEACDPRTGRCLSGCKEGWSGPTCHAKCQAGTYGRNCEHLCGKCRYGKPCYHDSGACPDRCAGGWKGVRCDTVCDEGSYGENCVRCGHCATGSSCDATSGACLSGCAAGWEGHFCKQKCLPGWYGLRCSVPCGNCHAQSCDHVMGSCGDKGCLHGWSGDTCMDACNPGFYGPNCNESCGHCQPGVMCDPVTGACGNGTKCNPGWYGNKCSLTCHGGSWGDNCSMTCGLCYQNKDCNPVTGLCDDGCFDGYYGTYCENAEEFKDLSSALVSPVMAISVSIVTVALCVLFLCLVVKWRRDEEDIPHAVLHKPQTEALLQPE